jgi:hypothetical protein
VDLYIRVRPGRFTLYKKAQAPLYEETRLRLLEHGVKSLYFSVADVDAYHQYVEENIVAIVRDDLLSGSRLQKRQKRISDTYETHAKGIRILPGQWRPHYPFEQIAWISPPWPSQDYIWLDFPEAIFSSIGLLYLSHVNPKFPSVFPNLPKVPWQLTSNGICFERRLPNGFVFGGTLRTGGPSVVEMELYMRNATPQPVRDIKLQTCVYLRGIREFSAFSVSNKYVHVGDKGWLPLETAARSTATPGEYRLGGRGGPKIVDLPLILTVSDQEDRIVAVTWHEHTYSLVGNPGHPCMHADPFFPDLESEQEARIQGKLIFLEGSREAFGD